MKKIFTAIFITLSIYASAQEKIKTLEVSDTIIFASVDRPGDLYLLTKEGQIQKFDKDGNLIIVYKDKNVPTLFDPRDGSRLFAYYRKDQVYDYYNPSFDVTASFKIDPAFAIQPWLICPSGDHKLWVLDASDHSLKKLNAQQTAVEVEVIIDSGLIQDATAFTYIREYQGFVFLLNPRKGIYIFNGIGKHIKTIEVKGIHNFNFLGEELYFQKNDQIEFFNLFSTETRKISTQPSHSIILTDERRFLVGLKSVDIYVFKP